MLCSTAHAAGTLERARSKGGGGETPHLVRRCVRPRRVPSKSLRILLLGDGWRSGGRWTRRRAAPNRLGSARRRGRPRRDGGASEAVREPRGTSGSAWSEAGRTFSRELVNWLGTNLAPTSTAKMWRREGRSASLGWTFDVDGAKALYAAYARDGSRSMATTVAPPSGTEVHVVRAAQSARWPAETVGAIEVAAKERRQGANVPPRGRGALATRG